MELSQTVRLCGRRDEVRQQAARERIVAEDVRPELHLEAVGRLAPGQRHHAGVVDEQVEPVEVVGGGEGLDRVERRQVEPADLGCGGGNLAAQGGEGVGGFAGVAAREDDRRAAPQQAARGLEADAAVGAGHDRDAAGLVGDVGVDPGGERRHRSAEGERRAPPALRAVPRRRHWPRPPQPPSRRPPGWGRPARSRPAPSVHEGSFKTCGSSLEGLHC